MDRKQLLSATTSLGVRHVETMMPSTVKIVSFVLLGMQFGAGKITLPRYYHDGMVMQADQNQTMIWGFTTSNNEPVVATVSCNFQAQTSTHEMELSAEPKHFKQSMAKGFVLSPMFFSFDKTQWNRN